MTAQPLPPGHIRAAFAPITRPAYCTCDPAADPHRHVVHVGTYDASLTYIEPPAVRAYIDRTDATDAEFEARLDRLDRLEVADESAVERLTSVLTSDSHFVGGRGRARLLAGDILAALKPPPPDGGGQAVQREECPHNEDRASCAVGCAATEDTCPRCGGDHSWCHLVRDDEYGPVTTDQPPDGTPIR